MTNAFGGQKKMHHDLTNVRLRAQATAAGLVQLCAEPRRQTYSGMRRSRLDRLFSGEQKVGPAEDLDHPAPR